MVEISKSSSMGAMGHVNLDFILEFELTSVNGNFY